MDIRPYADADFTDLVAVFTASVHELAAQCYTPQQLNAWAPPAPTLAPWRERLRREALSGFISYDGHGHIDQLYTSPAYARRGVASLLYSYVERTLVSLEASEIFTEASLVARPFFEHFGFVVVSEENVLFRNQSFRRYAMRKSLGEV